MDFESPFLHSLGIILVATRVLAAPPSKAPAPRALVFAQNPVRTPVPSEQVLPLSPTSGRLAHPWLEALSCVVPETRPLPPHDGGFSPERVCTLQSTARPDARGVYAARPLLEPGSPGSAPDAFAEASLFFHAAATLSYFRGLGWARPWPDGKPALRLVANVRLPSRDAGTLLPWGDARFVPASRGDSGPGEPRKHDTLWFGQGPVANLAYDGDTIAHEVTHALLEPLLPPGDWQLDESGANGAPGAIDEGLADYFAAALSGDPFLGEYAVRNADTWRSRNIHTLARCPEVLMGRRHSDGLLLSSALWAVREPSSTSQRVALDRAVLTALQASRPDSGLSLERLLEAIITALAPEHPELAESARKEFSLRGLLPACQRVLELEPGQSLSGASGPFQSPAGSTLGVKGLAPGFVQFHVRVPAATTALTLHFRSGPARFQPVVLAKRHQPIRWSYGTQTHPDAERTAEPEGTTSRSARIELEGATDVFLQVANAGDREGWYDTLSISFESEPPPPPAAPAPASPSPRAIWVCLGGAGAGLGGWLWRRRRPHFIRVIRCSAAAPVEHVSDIRGGVRAIHHQPTDVPARATVE